MKKPLCIDGYCGLGGWAEGFLAEGYDVIGFDIERHVYGPHRYPGQLVIQDVLTLHGSQFKDANCLVFSPPCQEYSYMAMPWSRAKAKAAAIRADTTGQMLANLNRLFDACFRIQAQASLAAGRHIPMVVENVRGAQPWVGRARWAFGSYFLWGDVPALMPFTRSAAKAPGMDWSDRTKRGQDFTRIAGQYAKVPGFRFDGGGRSFQTASVKTVSHPNIRDGHDHTKHLTNPAEHGIKNKDADGYERNHPNAFGWKSSPTSSSNISARKAASAMIAKIPEPLVRHIARTFRN